MKQSHEAQENRMAAQIAQSFVEQAEQDNLPAGTYYLDTEGATCPATQAAYRITVKSSVTSSGANLLNLQIIPASSPRNAISYAALTAYH